MITLEKVEQALSDLGTALNLANWNRPMLGEDSSEFARHLVVCRAQAEKAAVLCAEIMTAMEKLDLSPRTGP